MVDTLLSDRRTRRGKRTRLPPDPSSTLLQGVYVHVPPKTAPAKLIPNHSLNPMFGPLGMSHDVSYRLDASYPRTALSDIRPATAASLMTSKGIFGHGQWSRTQIPSRSLQGINRSEVVLLRQWMQAEMESFNAKWGSRDSTNVVEFLTLASRAAHKLFSHAFAELGRQEAKQCQDRANLMNDAWKAYSSMMNDILRRIVDQHTAARQRVTALDGTNTAGYRTLEIVNAEQEQEIEKLKEQVATLQTAAQHQRHAAPSDDDASHAKSRALKKISSVRFTSFKERKDSAVVVSDPADGGSTARGTSAKRRAAAVQSSADAVKFGAKRASMMAGALLQSLQTAQDEAEDHRSAGGGASALRAQNATLTSALEESRKEMSKMLDQIAELEKMADDMVSLESRVQVAEGERDEAVTRMVTYTPRPSADLGSLSSLSGSVAARVSQAVASFRNWPTMELARMLFGEAAGPQTSVMELAPQAFGCMIPVLGDRRLTRDDLLQAILEAKGPGFWLDYVPQVTARWLGQHLLSRGDADPTMLVDFLVGSSEEGNALVPDFYGCLQVYRSTVSMEMVIEMLEAAHEPTTQRMNRVEESNRKLLNDLEATKATLAANVEAERLREEGRKRREEESKLEKKNPVDAFLEMLVAGEQENGDSYWNDGFSGVGAGIDVHKLLRSNAHVRNRHMSKRETEKLVKEVWRDKMADSSGGKEEDLVDFLFTFLQKKVGIQSAVVETGYNLIFWLWKYSFDADCDLFLKILRGEVREDVYLSQKSLQDDLETVFSAAARTANKNKDTSTVKKADVNIALKKYFCVGDPGGKTLARFDTLMQALEEDQPGPTIDHTKVFEEDREFNQGRFAEAVREQWLQERMEYFSELEAVIYHEALGADECDRAQVTIALMKVDVNLNEKQALALVDTAFIQGADKHTVKLVLKRLKAGPGRSHPSPKQSLQALGNTKPKAAKSKPDAAATAKKTDPASAGSSRPASAKPKGKGK